MNADRPMPPHRVPTLTEVVVWPEQVAQPLPQEAADSVPEPLAERPAELPEESVAAPLTELPTEDQLTQRVLADIQRQVDLMLDYRLRETLAPLLARATDGLVRDARQELASTLRDVVARAVAQELSRHRTR
ncbi:hypothetical protein BH11PSE8_BH11PSE8_33650 [soil metagenome]